MNPERISWDDPTDRLRKAWIASVLDRMAQDPQEEIRIRGMALDLLEKKRAGGHAGAGHIERWERLLALPLAELSAALLEASAAGAELRHAHLFAGSLPARETNRIMAEARRSG